MPEQGFVGISAFGGIYNHLKRMNLPSNIVHITIVLQQIAKYTRYIFLMYTEPQKYHVNNYYGST